MTWLFSLALGGLLLAGESTILKVIVRSANVRSGPNAAAEVIARVPVATLLEAAGRQGAWFKVTVNNAYGKAVTGYIHHSVVEILGGEEAGGEKPRSSARRQAPRSSGAKEFAGGGTKLLAGLAMSNMRLAGEIPPDSTKKSKTGFAGGLGFESGGRVGFEADLLVTPGGTDLTATVEGETAKIRISGYGVSMPLMLKLRFLPGSTPYVLAGGEVGYILTQKLLIEYNGQTEERDVKDKINRLYYGLLFGGGFELRSGGMSVLLEGRYSLGLSNQVKDPAPGEYAKANAFQFVFSVKF